MKKIYNSPKIDIYLISSKDIMQLVAGSGENPGEAESKGDSGDWDDDDDLDGGSNIW